jgi:hypothetical protein
MLFSSGNVELKLAKELLPHLAYLHLNIYIDDSGIDVAILVIQSNISITNSSLLDSILSLRMIQGIIGYVMRKVRSLTVVGLVDSLLEGRTRSQSGDGGSDPTRAIHSSVLPIPP